MKRLPQVSLNIHILNIGILFLLTLIFYLPGSYDGVLFDRDLIVYSLPLKTFFINAIRTGEFPFWNPYICCGYPILGDVAIGYFYPLNFLFLIFKIHIALTLFTALHTFLAGLFLYLFLIKEKCTPLGSLLGAICFAFSGYLISVIHTQTFLVTSVWLVAYLYLLLYLNQQFTRITLLSALPLTFQLLHGDIFTYGISIVLGFLYLTICHKVPLKKMVLQTAIAIVISFGLSAIVLIPMVQLTLESQRFAKGVPANEAYEFSMNPFRLINFIIPYFEYYGFSPFYQVMWSKHLYPTKRLAPWAESIYVGIVPTLTFLHCLFNIRKNGTKQNFWLIVSVLAAIIATGKYLKLYNLLYLYLPGMKLLRYPEKFFIVTTLALCILVGLAFEKLLTKMTKKSYASLEYIAIPIFYAFAIVLLLKPQILELIMSLKAYYAGAEFIYTTIVFKLIRTCSLALIVILIGLMFKRHILSLKTTAIIVTLICTLDVFFINRQIFYYAPSSLLYAPPALEKYFEKYAKDPYYRIRTFLPGEAHGTYPLQNYRYHIKYGGKELLFDNAVAAYNISSMNGFSPLILQRYIKFFEDANNFTGFIKSFSMGAINFVLYNEEKQNLEHLGLKRILKMTLFDNHYVVFKNMYALPRTYVAYNTIFEPDSEKAAGIALKASNKYRLNIVTSKQLNLKTPKQHVRPAKILQYKNNKVVISADSPQRGVLVLSDTYYPEWQAYVNGKKSDIFLVNGYFRGVEIPTGKSTIVFKYIPLTFYLGLIITGIFTILVTAFLIQKTQQRT